MEVVDAATLSAMQAAGKLLVCQRVLDHSYGISAAAVRKLQAAGKLPLLDLDLVEDAVALRGAGFKVGAAGGKLEGGGGRKLAGGGGSAIKLFCCCKAHACVRAACGRQQHSQRIHNSAQTLLLCRPRMCTCGLTAWIT
jgi:hypothetical protein